MGRDVTLNEISFFFVVFSSNIPDMFKKQSFALPKDEGSISQKVVLLNASVHA